MTLREDVYEMLKKWAKSKFVMATSIICLFITGLILMVLSVQQTEDVNDAGDQKILGAYFSGWYYAVCQNSLVQLLSPFLFDFTVHHWEEEIGQLGCPWRLRNSIWRLIFVNLQLIVTIWQFIILVTNKQQKFWAIFYWLQWSLFVALCVVWVLDCDSLYDGLGACEENFDVTGFGPVVLALLNAEFTTTLPPYFYGPYRPNWQYQQYEDTTVARWNLQVVDGCYITPYVYVPIVEWFVLVLTYIVYKFARMYRFEDEEDDDEDEDDDEVIDRCWYKIRRRRSDDGGIEKKKTNFLELGTKRHKKTSLAEQDGNRMTTTAGQTNASAYNLGKYHVDEPHFDPTAKIPTHWMEREPSFEKNYS